MSFYSGKTYGYQAKEGDTYDKLKRVYGICICDFEFTIYDEYKAEYASINKLHREDILDDGIETIYLELPKIRNQENLDYDNPLTQWLLFIDGENKEGVKIAMEKNENIRKAYITKEYLTGDEEFRRLADLRQKSEMDFNSFMKEAKEEAIEEGRKEGIEKGIKEGIKEGKMQIAKEMLKDGYILEKIADITKLPIDDIKKLKF